MLVQRLLWFKCADTYSKIIFFLIFNSSNKILVRVVVAHGSAVGSTVASAVEYTEGSVVGCFGGSEIMATNVQNTYSKIIFLFQYWIQGIKYLLELVLAMDLHLDLRSGL